MKIKLYTHTKVYARWQAELEWWHWSNKGFVVGLTQLTVGWDVLVYKKEDS